MKSRRYHALPIPPRAVLLLERAIAGGREDSKYVFPSTAVREGPGDLGKRLTEEEKKKQKEPVPALPDLLGEANAPHFSPHDIRRAFATTCGDRSVRGDATSAVLDHAGIETGQQLVRSAEVTRLAYDYSQKLELKAMAMETWTDALLAAVESEWRKHRLPPRPGYSLPIQEDEQSYLVMEREKAKADEDYLATVLEPWEMEVSPEMQPWLEQRAEEERAEYGMKIE